MKGNPLIRTTVVLLFLLLILWPVLRVTRHSAHSNQLGVTPSAPVVPSGTDAKLRATIQLHCAPDAAECSVSQAGRILLTPANRISPGEYSAPVEIAKGTDLIIKASWPDGDPHAVRINVLVHGYQTPLEKSFWAQESLEDAMVIPDSFLQPIVR
jgi:hypothetical protein